MPLNILDLPSELLDRIVELVITHQDSPVSTSDRVAWPRELETLTSSTPDGRDNVMYCKNQEAPYHNWKSASPTLLLVNRQLAELTRRRLAQFSNSSHYALDVMLVNETELWPTWTFLTPPCQHVNKLTVTLRITGTSPTLDGRKYRFTPFDGAPPIVWCFFYLLSRFLECGPLAEDPEINPPAHDRHPFTINELTLNVETPSGLIAPRSISYENWLQGRDNKDPRTSYTWPYNTVETLMIWPEWLVKLISDYIGYALDMQGLFLRGFGHTLHKCIGTIRICLDGSVVKVHAVDRRLKEYVDRQRQQLTGFAAKLVLTSIDELYEERKRAGLPVVY
ncbi:uncharacterized protein LDX57_002137 [Aspergillus melleus]|uniref:uncharacterized protein n=1 Tax=Aspergillus melleus TaxID=138277 RepID=UPI001E8DEC58|nr:uncharacterized protein LDX57_002137 [Aspergillus melleus]KAH8424386.1 hypothetical protein LDX57_002137 [Aspergillus melleus]